MLDEHASDDLAMPDEAPAPAAQGCACGSGLAAEVCCALDLTGLAPAEPSPENQQRLVALAEARRTADQPLATELSIAILTEQPTLLEALAMLFLIRRDQANRPAALALIRRAVALAPEDTRFVRYLVEQLMEDKAWPEAQVAARRALRARPADPVVHETLGDLFLRTHRADHAEHHFRRALALGERRPLLLLQFARALQQQGKFAEARAAYAEILERTPRSALALIGRAEMERLAGDLAAAAERLAEAETLLPPLLELARAKAQLAYGEKRYEAVPELLATIGEGAGEEGADDAYLRGQALDKLGRHDEAFAAFETANRLHEGMAGGGFNLDNARAIAATARAFVADEGDNGLPVLAVAPGAQPLFVMGFPRSGTTMLEQSLSMHPAIVAAGELRDLGSTAQASGRLLGSSAPYPLSLAELWMADQQDQLGLLRDHYLNGARRGLALGEGVRWFTDKALTNELYLGFAHLLFPQSPVIHIVRHPLDVVVSNYANGLPHGGFRGGVGAVADYYKLLFETAEATQAANPDIRYLRVRYEDILEDQEGWTRRILDFVGEPFDDACLRFHENERYGRTVSHAQVREKINTRSKARYRNYFPHLSPAMEVLAPVIERLGYEI